MTAASLRYTAAAAAVDGASGCCIQGSSGPSSRIGGNCRQNAMRQDRSSTLQGDQKINIMQCWHCKTQMSIPGIASALLCLRMLNVNASQSPIIHLVIDRACGCLWQKLC
jgi:hypothetical protein